MTNRVVALSSAQQRFSFENNRSSNSSWQNSVNDFSTICLGNVSDSNLDTKSKSGTRKKTGHPPTTRSKNTESKTREKLFQLKSDISERIVTEDKKIDKKYKEFLKCSEDFEKEFSSLKDSKDCKLAILPLRHSMQKDWLETLDNVGDRIQENSAKPLGTYSLLEEKALKRLERSSVNIDECTKSIAGKSTCFLDKCLEYFKVQANASDKISESKKTSYSRERSKEVSVLESSMKGFIEDVREDKLEFMHLSRKLHTEYLAFQDKFGDFVLQKDVDIYQRTKMTQEYKHELDNIEGSVSNLEMIQHDRMLYRLDKLKSMKNSFFEAHLNYISPISSRQLMDQFSEIDFSEILKPSSEPSKPLNSSETMVSSRERSKKPRAVALQVHLDYSEFPNEKTLEKKFSAKYSFLSGKSDSSVVSHDGVHSGPRFRNSMYDLKKNLLDNDYVKLSKNGTIVKKSKPTTDKTQTLCLKGLDRIIKLLNLYRNSNIAMKNIHKHEVRREESRVRFLRVYESLVKDFHKKKPPVILAERNSSGSASRFKSLPSKQSSVLKNEKRIECLMAKIVPFTGNSPLRKNNYVSLKIKNPNDFTRSDLHLHDDNDTDVILRHDDNDTRVILRKTSQKSARNTYHKYNKDVDSDIDSDAGKYSDSDSDKVHSDCSTVSVNFVRSLSQSENYHDSDEKKDTKRSAKKTVTERTPEKKPVFSGFLSNSFEWLPPKPASAPRHFSTSLTVSASQQRPTPTPRQRPASARPSSTSLTVPTSRQHPAALRPSSTSLTFLASQQPPVANEIAPSIKSFEKKETTAEKTNFSVENMRHSLGSESLSSENKPSTSEKMKQNPAGSTQQISIRNTEVLNSKTADSSNSNPEIESQSDQTDDLVTNDNFITRSENIDGLCPREEIEAKKPHQLKSILKKKNTEETGRRNKPKRASFCRMS